MRMVRWQEPVALYFLLLLALVAVYPSPLVQQQTVKSDTPLPHKQRTTTADSAPAYDILPVLDAETLLAQKSKNTPDRLPTRAQQAQTGNWPTLDANYSAIGFDTFLSLVDGLGGRFFLNVNDRLGPEVSLQRPGVLRRTLPSGMALARPYSVSDTEIASRLSTLSLPTGAHVDSVILLLPQSVDGSFWRQIRRALARHGAQLEDTALIKAVYEKAGNQVRLVLTHAISRRTSKRITLHERIYLPA